MSAIPLITIVGSAGMLLFLLFAVFRTRKLAWVMREASVISKSAAIPSFKAVEREFEKEFTRARRNERPLTVCVLEIEGDELLENIGILVSGNTEPTSAAYRQAMQTARIVFLLLGAILRDAMRECDIIAYDVGNDDYVLLMPDSNKNEAAHAVGRMQQLLNDRTMASSRVGLAEFPADGLTLDDLMKTARATRAVEFAAETAPVETAA